MSAPAAWQQRVIDERADLAGKLTRLREFFATEQFGALDPEDQKLMRQQEMGMTIYHRALEARIARFGLAL